MLAIAPAFAATVYPIESNRAHAATGAFGCSVSGASVATPSVITCSAAHNLQDGDAIQITGVGGTTTDNTVGYAKVTSYSTTTFGFYSDANLTTGITGTGAYTSGGVVTMAYDISGISGDFTIKASIDSMTASKKALVSIQESADGFVSDIRTLEVFHISGTVPHTGISKTWRSYNVPDNRFGVTSARLRLYVQALDSAGTANISLWLEY